MMMAYWLPNVAVNKKLWIMIQCFTYDIKSFPSICIILTWILDKFWNNFEFYLFFYQIIQLINMFAKFVHSQMGNMKFEIKSKKFEFSNQDFQQQLVSKMFIKVSSLWKKYLKNLVSGVKGLQMALIVI